MTSDRRPTTWADDTVRPTAQEPGRQPTTPPAGRVGVRRVLVAAGAAALTVAIVGLAVARPDPTPAPEVPGPPGPDAPVVVDPTWSSGAASEDPEEFAEWRGRPLDNVTVWPNRGTWDEIRDPDIYGAVSALADHPMLTIGIAMLPEEEDASFAECRTGSYDEYFRDVGSVLDDLGRGDAVVRLGWEANGDWYAWSIGDDVADYRECFRRQATAIRATAPDVLIDWNMNKDSMMSRPVTDAYPGDDVVDIIGVDFYDMYPAYPDQAAWDEDYHATQNGGPRGLGAWLEFAMSRGKKLSVPEWGLNTGTGGGADNAYYFEAMYRFFQDNAAHIAYETYFNLQHPSFMIHPPGMNPEGSETYRELWGRAP